MEPTSGKIGEKAYIFSLLMKQNNHVPWQGLLFLGSVRVCGCFISTVRWKYSLFLRFSPWRDPRLRHFSGYPFGTSRKKASTLFYDTAYLGAVLKFPADTAIRGRSSAPVSAKYSLPWRRTHFQRGERHPPATAGGASSRAVSPLSIALRGTFGRSSPLHAALPCGGGRPQSSLALAPPAVKGAYFSLSTVNLNRTIPLGCVVDYIIYWNY